MLVGPLLVWDMPCESVPSLIVNLVTEARGIDDGQRDARALLIQLKLCGRSACHSVTNGLDGAGASAYRR